MSASDYIGRLQDRDRLNPAARQRLDATSAILFKSRDRVMTSPHRTSTRDSPMWPSESCPHLMPTHGRCRHLEAASLSALISCSPSPCRRSPEL